MSAVSTGNASRATRLAPTPEGPVTAEQTQREARERWLAEQRESPDARVRLQALESWAQQPGKSLDPLTDALMDEDQAVRTRAYELYEQQRAREAAALTP